MKKLQGFFVFLVTATLIFIFTNPFLLLFAKITKQSIYGGSWGFSGKAYEEGFFISYSFFITLALVIFGGKKKYQILSVLLALIFLIQIGVPESLIISAGTAIIAWLIGTAALFIKGKIIKK
jgi:hypothetical protein